MTDSALNRSTRILNWWYKPEAIAQVTRSTQVFTSSGFTQVQATWYDSTNMTQAASVSQAVAKNLGGVATTWSYVNPDHRNDIVQMCQRFWNTPWRQVYFEDMNYQWNLTHYGQIASTYNGVETDSLYSAPPYSQGRNRGGWRIPTGATDISFPVLPYVRIENGSQYRCIFNARDLQSTTATRTVR